MTVALLVSEAAWGQAATTKPTSTQPAKSATKRPSLVGLMLKAEKLESAGQYALATRATREALSVSVVSNARRVPEIRKQLRRLARLQSVARRLDVLISKLSDKPDDIVVRERIIRICVVELDAPARAAKFLNEDVDQILQTYIPLAAGDVDKLTEATCRELGQWYLSNIGKTSRFARVAMLRRAAACYGRFLQLHKSGGTEQSQAAEKYEQIVEQLAQLGEALAGGSARGK